MSRYLELAEFTTDGFVVTDGQGLILESNQAAALILQCPKEFLLGKPLGLFVTAGVRPRFYRCLSRLHRGADTDVFESRVGRRESERVVFLRVSRAEPEASRPTGFRWLMQDITEYRRVEAVRDQLLHRLVSAQEDERRRVARELHDSVGQLLTALMLNIRSVRDAGPLSPAALARLDEVQRSADELGRVTHDLAARLRPTALDDVGLVAALQQLLHDWSTHSGLTVQFQAVGLDATRLPPEVETALYRVIQEALTNALKHARAQIVSVVVERQDGRAIAVVEDDGVGFDPASVTATDRLGLLGMRERLALLGGQVEIESAPGGGTTILARIPLSQPKADGQRPSRVPPGN